MGGAIAPSSNDGGMRRLRLSHIVRDRISIVVYLSLAANEAFKGLQMRHPNQVALPVAFSLIRRAKPCSAIIR